MDRIVPNRQVCTCKSDFAQWLGVHEHVSEHLQVSLHVLDGFARAWASEHEGLERRKAAKRLMEIGSIRKNLYCKIGWDIELANVACGRLPASHAHRLWIVDGARRGRSGRRWALAGTALGVAGAS